MSLLGSWVNRGTLSPTYTQQEKILHLAYSQKFF
jgi:hypothetical protein